MQQGNTCKQHVVVVGSSAGALLEQVLRLPAMQGLAVALLEAMNLGVSRVCLAWLTHTFRACSLRRFVRHFAPATVLDGVFLL